MLINIMPNALRGREVRPDQWPACLRDGVEAMGDKAVMTQAPDPEADLQVFWGLRKAWGKRALRAGLRSLVMERAYLGDRLHWRAAGFDGLNGLMDDVYADCPDDRWREYWADDMLPWTGDSGYAVIMGQVPGDSALYGQDPYEWAESIAEEALDRFGKVIFRPHPVAKRRRYPAGCEVCHPETTPMWEVLEGARCVITYNSNAGVDAIMRGIPVIAMHEGSMVYEIASHALSEPLVRPERWSWGSKMAYRQWLPSELRDGTAWGWLRERV